MKIKEIARKESYSLIHNTLKRLGTKKEESTNKLLGYTSMDLHNHINENFKEGMTWENRSLWHIDHKKPVAQFVKEGIMDTRIINALDNLQLLWSQDNMTKGANWAAVDK